ncbi:HTH-type transcriptional regulator PksA [Paenibacillus sp. L3-i20]|nr:HTH-type transcriptional regulator PksA [Paenibacillus sp. L3-i20]
MIAEVAWRIVSRDGVDAASVRNIAKEAGLSMGSMRHYFRSQAELCIYLMELVNAKAKKRIESMIATTSSPTFQQLVDLTMQLLPIHNETKTEMEVWLWFHAKVPSTPELQPLNKMNYEGSYLLFKLVIDALIHLQMAKPTIEAQYEIDRLFALVDGLSMHCYLHPNYVSAEKITYIVTRHLEDLCVPAK